RERGMLGDAGANVLGAAVGAAATRRLSAPSLLTVLASVVSLTLASERISFSAVIERTPALRALDRLGRRTEPTAGSGGQPPTRPPDRRRSVARSVLRGAGVILVVTVFARILGFVRYRVFGASIGAGDVGTAYSTANMLPSVLFEIAAGGVLAAVVVPLIAGL